MSLAMIDRRRHERFALPPMCNEVRVQRIRSGRMELLTGSAYDVSEGGLRIELDDRLEPGEHVNATLVLPGTGDDAHPREVYLACDVKWVNPEDDDPAMPRMALGIVRFLDETSRARLLTFLGARPALRAA